MADHNHCACEILDGLFEDVFGGHVEMVGRLVKYEQVDRLKEQAYHGEAVFFSTRQDLDFLVRRFPSEHECPEDVADFGADISDSHPVDGVKHRDFLIEQLSLILREISDFDIVADFEVAGEWYLIHDTLYQR